MKEPWVYQLSQGEVLHFYSSATATINSGTIMAAAKPETVNLVSTSPSLNPGDNNYMGDKFSVSTHYRMSFFLVTVSNNINIRLSFEISCKLYFYR